MKILERAYGEKEIDEIIAAYNEAKLADGMNFYEPTLKDLKLYVKWVDGVLSTKEIANEMGVSGKTTVERRFAWIGKMAMKKEINLP